MIRSTLSVSVGLAVIAVVLASLWVGFGPRPRVGQDKQAAAAVPLSQPQRSGVDAKGQIIRTISPGSTSSSRMEATAATGSSPSATAPTNPPAISKPAVEPEASVDQGESASNPSVRTDGAPGDASGSPATAGGSVDLNTATVEQLNALGAGMIGKRIMEFRPYTSPDELISRRVLKRADYDAIKNVITVR